MEFSSVQMNCGEIFNGKEIGELVNTIVNLFSEKRLSYDEALIVLSQTKDVIGELCIVQSLERR